MKKTYFKFNQISMRPAYNGEELFFEQNKSFLKNLLFLRQKIVINFPKNWVFQKIGPEFCSKINGEFCFGAFCKLLQGLEVQNKSNTMRTPLWPLGKEFRRFQKVCPLKIKYLKAQSRFGPILLNRFGFKLKVQTVWGIQYLTMGCLVITQPF